MPGQSTPFLDVDISYSAQGEIYLENTQHKKKRAERVTQMVEYLPSKCEALNSNPRMARKIKKRC
jgi:hypothetical protein